MNIANPDLGAEVRYDGHVAAELATRLGLPSVVLFDEVASTLDVAHALGGSGAPAGTLVLADAQSAGRGRMGRVWQSERGAGVWLTLLERPEADELVSVLSLRIALRLAQALQPLAGDAIALKWPNDLFVGGGKLAGVLLETRWRGGHLDWLAAGVGINLRAPSGLAGAALSPDTDRLTVLRAAVPAIRAAIAARGPLTGEERAAFSARDLARGRRCRAPAEGTVVGIDDTGALLIDTGGARVAVRGGSLVLADALEQWEDGTG